MASIADIPTKTFNVLHLFSGIGGGGLGFKNSNFSWKGVTGKFRNILAIDADFGACMGYKKIVGSRVECIDLFSREQYRRFHGNEPPADWKEMTPQDLRNLCGDDLPDGVFTSPPCKGLSGLLPSETANSDKYQALNELTIRGIWLVLEAFKDRPLKFILFENVPRIKTRGAHLLDEITNMLKKYGYAVDLSDHDCGLIGGLGQKRRRFLLIARHKASFKPFIYKPPIIGHKTIGDVIGPMPLPDDPTMGAMHRLPRLKWLTWMRLALIPAGGDWRDLQKIAPEEYRLMHIPRGGGPWGVQQWTEQSAVVTRSLSVKGSNATHIANPRVPDKANRHQSHYSVTSFSETAGTVTGATHVANGAPCIADVRIKEKGANYNGSPGLYGVMEWSEASPAVTGSLSVSSSNTPGAIADPRLPESKGVYPNRFRVVKWDGQAPTVTGDTDVQCGAPSIPDPRLGHAPRQGSFGILKFNETAPTVVGSATVGKSNGPQAIADPRLNCSGGNTPESISFVPENDNRSEPPPVIIATDGAWHRPLTTLELATLQGFPTHLEDGSPLVLHGNNDGKWREWIGNAVPPLTAKAIAETIGVALLQNDLGDTFTLGTTDIWVIPANQRPAPLITT